MIVTRFEPLLFSKNTARVACGVPWAVVSRPVLCLVRHLREEVPDGNKVEYGAARQQARLRRRVR